MIARKNVLELLHSKMQSVNLRKHCYAVEAVMRSLAVRLNPDLENTPEGESLKDKWGIVGLVHDGDYEVTKTDIANHAKLMAGWVRDLGETDEELLEGIESHGWFHQGKLPQTKMQWALFCSDELTGLITAVTLVRPSKKISEVTVQNVLDKWHSKNFAAGAKREDIEKCEKELGIPKEEFVEIALKAMQGISQDLGL